MIKILPSKQITLHTDYTISQVKAILQDNLQKRNYSPFDMTKEKLFEGYIKGDSFKISRVIHHRNSFLPMIHGDLRKSLGEGTDIVLAFRLHRAVLIFMCIWLGIVGLVALGSLFALVFVLNSFNGALLIPLGMFLFGLMLAPLGFEGEQKRAEKELISLFKAEII